MQSYIVYKTFDHILKFYKLQLHILDNFLFLFACDEFFDPSVALEPLSTAAVACLGWVAAAAVVVPGWRRGDPFTPPQLVRVVTLS